jgi:hypothetical protein
MSSRTLVTGQNGTKNLSPSIAGHPARGRRTYLRRESVGTDSRVLRLGGPVNTSAEASGAKLFSRRKSGRITVVKRAKFRANDETHARICRRSKNYDSKETRIS